MIYLFIDFFVIVVKTLEALRSKILDGVDDNKKN